MKKHNWPINYWAKIHHVLRALETNSAILKKDHNEHHLAPIFLNLMDAWWFEPLRSTKTALSDMEYPNKINPKPLRSHILNNSTTIAAAPTSFFIWQQLEMYQNAWTNWISFDFSRFFHVLLCVFLWVCLLTNLMIHHPRHPILRTFVSWGRKMYEPPVLHFHREPSPRLDKNWGWEVSPTWKMTGILSRWGPINPDPDLGWWLSHPRKKYGNIGSWSTLAHIGQSENMFLFWRSSQKTFKLLRRYGDFVSLKKCKRSFKSLIG